MRCHPRSFGILNSINIDESSPFVNLVPADGLNQMAAAAVSGTAEEHPGTAGRPRSRPGVTNGSEGNVVFPVAAVAAAGWLLLFIVLLVVPPSSGPRRGGGLDGGTAPMLPSAGDEPPAVISLLTGKLDKLGFQATLIDLAARGWFQVNGLAGQAPAGLGGAWGPAGPAMCVVPAETPAGPLAPFERRVVAHVALRAGARGEVPAPALSDGFEGGETDFMKAFREEVDADARQRGLTRPRLSGRRIGLLCALLLIPAGALLVAVTAAHRHGALAYAGLPYLVACGVTIGVGTSRRRSAAGQEALDRWRSAVAEAPGGAASLAASGGAAGLAASVSGGGRVLAYAAALGVAPAAVAVFAQGGTNVAWSSYRGSWQQIEIETSTWPWPRVILVMVAIIFGPVLYVIVVIWLGTHGMAALAEELVGPDRAGRHRGHRRVAGAADAVPPVRRVRRPGDQAVGGQGRR